MNGLGIEGVIVTPVSLSADAAKAEEKVELAFTILRTQGCVKMVCGDDFSSGKLVEQRQRRSHDPCRVAHTNFGGRVKE
jgi:hypothetical protein